ETTGNGIAKLRDLTSGEPPSNRFTRFSQLEVMAQEMNHLFGPLHPTLSGHRLEAPLRWRALASRGWGAAGRPGPRGRRLSHLRTVGVAVLRPEPCRSRPRSGVSPGQLEWRRRQRGAGQRAARSRWRSEPASLHHDLAPHGGVDFAVVVE